MSCDVVWCLWCHVMFVMSCNVMWCRVMSVMFVMSCDVMSCDVMWCHGCHGCHVMSCDVMFVMSCDVMSCHVVCDVWCHVMFVMSCDVMSCDVMWCHVMSCDVVMLCDACDVMWFTHGVCTGNHIQAREGSAGKSRQWGNKNPLNRNIHWNEMYSKLGTLRGEREQAIHCYVSDHITQAVVCSWTKFVTLQSTKVQ